MLALHEQMQAAHTPAAALAHCQTELRDRDEQAFAVASAFVCFGFG